MKKKSKCKQRKTYHERLGEEIMRLWSWPNKADREFFPTVQYLDEHGHLGHLGQRKQNG